MAFDHGELNVPGRTDTINRDLDRHKAVLAADRRAKAKAAAKFLAEQRKEAAALLASLPPERFEVAAARLGITSKQARAEFKRMAFWQPASFIALERKA
jgi:phytoene dehydrogenase-like protein